MTIKEFIAKVGKIENATVIKNAIIAKEYLSFTEKKALAKRIVAKSIEEENGFVRIDEINKYLIFTIEVLQAYTNLEFDEDLDIAAEEYDLLAKGNKLGLIIDMFEPEYKVILDLVNMEESYVTQKNSVAYQMATLFDGLNNTITKLGDALSDKIDNFDLNDIGVSANDMTMLTDFLGKYAK
jgi:hypothetical protein